MEFCQNVNGFSWTVVLKLYGTQDYADECRAYLKNQNTYILIICNY